MGRAVSAQLSEVGLASERFWSWTRARLFQKMTASLGQISAEATERRQSAERDAVEREREESGHLWATWKATVIQSDLSLISCCVCWLKEVLPEVTACSRPSPENLCSAGPDLYVTWTKSSFFCSFCFPTIWGILELLVKGHGSRSLAWAPVPLRVRINPGLLVRSMVGTLLMGVVGTFHGWCHADGANTQKGHVLRSLIWRQLLATQEHIPPLWRVWHTTARDLRSGTRQNNQILHNDSV